MHCLDEQVRGRSILRDLFPGHAGLAGKRCEIVDFKAALLEVSVFNFTFIVDHGDRAAPLLEQERQSFPGLEAGHFFRRFAFLQGPLARLFHNFGILALAPSFLKLRLRQIVWVVEFDAFLKKDLEMSADHISGTVAW